MGKKLSSPFIGRNDSGKGLETQKGKRIAPARRVFKKVPMIFAAWFLPAGCVVGGAPGVGLAFLATKNAAGLAENLRRWQNGAARRFLALGMLLF